MNGRYGEQITIRIDEISLEIQDIQATSLASVGKSLAGKV